MDLSTIIALIDEDLDRLQRAREIIVSLNPSQQTDQNPRAQDPDVPAMPLKAKVRKSSRRAANNTETIADSPAFADSPALADNLELADSPEPAGGPEPADGPEPLAAESATSGKSMRHVAKPAGGSRARRSRTGAPVAPRALGGPVNDRPVFVSAKSLSSRPAANGNGTAASADSPPLREKAAPEVPLTAEALAHRWIANSLLH